MTTFALSNILAGNAFPIHYTFTGAYAGLEVHLAELPTGIIPELAAAVQADLAPLGLDPLAAVMTEISPNEGALRGEEYVAFHERLDSLTIAETLTYRTAMQKTLGLLLSKIVGKWNADVPLTPANLAGLPPSIQRTILEQSANATLSEEKKTG